MKNALHFIVRVCSWYQAIQSGLLMLKTDTVKLLSNIILEIFKRIQYLLNGINNNQRKKYLYRVEELYMWKSHYFQISRVNFLYK